MGERGQFVGAGDVLGLLFVSNLCEEHDAPRIRPGERLGREEDTGNARVGECSGGRETRSLFLGEAEPHAELSGESEAQSRLVRGLRILRILRILHVLRGLGTERGF